MQLGFQQTSTVTRVHGTVCRGAAGRMHRYIVFLAKEPVRVDTREWPTGMQRQTVSAGRNHCCPFTRGSIRMRCVSCSSSSFEQDRWTQTQPRILSILEKGPSFPIHGNDPVPLSIHCRRYLYDGLAAYFATCDSPSIDKEAVAKGAYIHWNQSRKQAARRRTRDSRGPCTGSQSCARHHQLEYC